MEELKVVGLDLAKSVFQVHGIDARGRKVLGAKLKRGQVLEYFARLPVVRVGMEACAGAHEWARRLRGLGHEVKLMAPQHVKAYVQGNKTDARDAAAIAEAAARESVPAVAVRTLEGQQMQALHRMREGLMKQRTATANQLRGLLAEFGVVMPAGVKKLREQASLWCMQAGVELVVMREGARVLLEQLGWLEERIARLEGQIKQLHRVNAASRLLETIPGVGLLGATAVVASFGGCESFESARKLASCLGLTPREHSSGGKQQLLGISKRGNGYIRKLLIHGARAVLRVRCNNPLYADSWEVRLAARRGTNVAAVALAAKNARRIWALLRSGQAFDPAYGQREALST